MFNEYPLISVIIPVYKVEPYLDTCVSSVVNQSYRNLEIILVDDGSPDACPAMCDAWADRDSRVRVIHKENGGLSDARNAGLAAMTGDYISFVDSDDWLGEEFYRNLMESMEVVDAQIAVSRIVRHYEDHEEDDGFVSEKDVFTPEEVFATYITGHGITCEAWNKVYRKSCFADLRYPAGRLNEDEFITYKVVDRAERIAYCKDAAYYYRQREGSIMYSHIPTDNFDFLDASLERLKYFEKRYPDVYRKDKAAFCVACVVRYRLALGADAGQTVLDRIRDYRAQVQFTHAELSGYSRRERIYVRESGRNMHAFAKRLNRRGLPE